MKKFKAFSLQLNETFYTHSPLDLTVAVAVKYLDRNGEERVTVGWGTTTHGGAVHGVLSKINASSLDDGKIVIADPCNVEEIS